MSLFFWPCSHRSRLLWKVASIFRTGSTFKCCNYRVSSERNVSRKNSKMFVRISQTFLRNFVFFRENKWSEISRKCETRKFWGNIFAKCENFMKMRKCKNFVKTMSVIASTINCSKELVELSALIPQYLKFWWREFDFSRYLFKFLSVRPQYIRSTMKYEIWGYVFLQIFLCFSHNF